MATYYATQRGQTAQMTHSASNVLQTVLAQILVDLDNIGPEVNINGLGIILERDDRDIIFVSTSAGEVNAENNLHAWWGPNTMTLQFSNGGDRIGDTFEIPWAAAGKGGNGYPVPREPVRKQINVPFDNVAAVVLQSARVTLFLDEG
jgi:hypothetical protein